MQSTQWVHQRNGGALLGAYRTRASRFSERMARRPKRRLVVVVFGGVLQGLARSKEAERKRKAGRAQAAQEDAGENASPGEKASDADGNACSKYEEGYKMWTEGSRHGVVCITIAVSRRF